MLATGVSRETSAEPVCPLPIGTASVSTLFPPRRRNLSSAKRLRWAHRNDETQDAAHVELLEQA